MLLSGPVDWQLHQRLCCGVGSRSLLETVGQNVILFGGHSGRHTGPTVLLRFPVCCLSSGDLSLCVCVYPVCESMFPLSGRFVLLCLHTHRVSCLAKARGPTEWPTTAGCPTSCPPTALCVCVCVFKRVICPRPHNTALTESWIPAHTPR